MKLLLDTHTLLWFLAGSARRCGYRQPISLVEIALKVRINKLRLTVPFGILFPAQLSANRVQLWAIEARHAEALRWDGPHRMSAAESTGPRAAN